MKDKELALRLRAALRYIQSISSNDNFYDDVAKVSFHLASTLEELEQRFPEFTVYEQAFMEVVSGATGHAGIEAYVIAMRDADFDYTKLENGCALRDCEIVFDEAYKLGLDRALEG